MSLNVVIVGGGVAGFATAIGLAKHGHRVTVLERRRDETEESGSAIQLQPNAVKILKTWGMMEDLAKIAHDNENAYIVDGLTGKHIVTMEYASRGGQWIGLRKDIRILFQHTAQKHGVKIIFDRRVLRVQEDDQKATVSLEGGQHVTADLIIGADGTRSKIRASLFPNYKPTVLPECCFQVRIPYATMRADPDTAPLIERRAAQVFSAPGRSTFSSIIAHSEVFDLQVIDHEYDLEQDPHPDTWTEPWHDTAWIRDRFADHLAPFTKALAASPGPAYKWRFVLVNKLPSWTSPGGRIILVGDACHAMPPYSGQGSAMGIEDAEVLSRVFAKATPEHDLYKLAKVYESVRRPRCDIIQKLAMANGVSIGATSTEMQQQRNSLLRQLNAAIQASTNSGVVADKHARFATPGFAKWLDDYDPTLDIRDAFKESGIKDPQARL